MYCDASKGKKEIAQTFTKNIHTLTLQTRSGVLVVCNARSLAPKPSNNLQCACNTDYSSCKLLLTPQKKHGHPRRLLQSHRTCNGNVRKITKASAVNRKLSECQGRLSFALRRKMKFSREKAEKLFSWEFSNSKEFSRIDMVFF